jgi:hypothetical protein
MLEHIFRARPPFTQLCVDEKSTGQSEKVADKTQYPPASLGLSCEKNVRRWLTDINAFLSFTLSAFSMAMPLQMLDKRTAEDTLFIKDILMCEAWRDVIVKGLKSKDGGAQATSLLQNCHVLQTKIFTRTSGTQHEYIAVGISTPDQLTRTLPFERRDRNTGPDDPSPQHLDNGDRTNLCCDTTQMFRSAWNTASRVTSVYGTPAADRVWSDPTHSQRDIVVRCI